MNLILKETSHFPLHCDKCRKEEQFYRAWHGPQSAWHYIYVGCGRTIKIVESAKNDPPPFGIVYLSDGGEPLTKEDLEWARKKAVELGLEKRAEILLKRAK